MLLLSAVVLAAMSLVVLIALIAGYAALHRKAGYREVERQAAHPAVERRHPAWSPRMMPERRLAARARVGEDRRRRTERRQASS